MPEAAAEPPLALAALLDEVRTGLRDAGFTEIESYAIGPDWYPWITRARKPESQPVEKAA